jgi:hypothetical protein
MNFLNHYETWNDEANVRSNTIIAAKFDEIDKELELRLHLHEPRIRRTEMDVHNVRAGNSKQRNILAFKVTLCFFNFKLN